jgi:hypothetical protein
LKISNKKRVADERSQQSALHAFFKKRGKILNQDFIRGVKSLHYTYSHKKVSAGASQWHLRKLSAWVLNISK